MSPEALDAMAILATIDWLDDKKARRGWERFCKVNPHVRRGVRYRGAFFRHQSPL